MVRILSLSCSGKPQSMGSFALCSPGVFGQKWYWLEINGGENNSLEVFTPWLSMPGPDLQWLQSSLRPQLLGASLTNRFGSQIPITIPYCYLFKL